MFKASDRMTKNVITVNKDTPIYKAIAILLKNKVSGLPVIDKDNTLIGILSEKDALKLLLGEDGSKLMVADFMTSEVIAFDESESLTRICNFFIENSYKRVPIVSNGKLVGIISRSDILKQIMEVKQIDFEDHGLKGEDY